MVVTMQGRPRVHLRALVAPLMTIALLVPAVPAVGVNVAQSVIVSPDPVNFTPHVVSGQVNAIVQIGSKVIVGGEFTAVRQTANGADIPRNNIFAFNANTGVIDTAFAPNLDRAVLALAPAPDGNVFAGGNFNSVNGAGAAKLAKLNVTNGQRITSFTATANSRVRQLEVRGNTLYVAGNFTQLAGAARERLGAVNATTGGIDPNLNLPITAPRVVGTSPFVYAMDVSPDGSKIVVIGNFTRIAGIERWQAGMINTGTPATVANWETDGFRPACSSSFDTYMRDVDFSPDGSYFAIVTTGAHAGGPGAGVLCDTATRWESAATGENLTPTWRDYTGGDTLSSVAVTGTAVYVGGHQRWMNNPFVADRVGPGAVDRQGIAALDPINGIPFSWNPGRSRGVGVFALTSTPAGLFVGSDTDLLGGETHRKLGMFPTAGGTTVPPHTVYSLPSNLYNVPSSIGPVNSLGRRTFDGTNVGPHGTLQTPGFDWSTTRGAMVVNGFLYHGTSTGGLVAHAFDGTTLGAGQTVPLNGLTNFPLANVTGMFFDTQRGRLYFTVSGDANLYWRWFTPESRIVGAERFVAGGSVNWSTARGVTMADGKIYYGSTDGNLRSVNFVNGIPSGSPTIVSPASAGFNWASRGLFVFGGQSTGDITPPTRPGKPSGQSNSPGTIDINWAGSIDNVSTTLTYHIFRDGSEVATLDSSQTTVQFHDTGLAGGSTHTYHIVAEDASGNDSQPSLTSDPIAVQSGSSTIFADDFSTSNFSKWTSVTGLTIDPTRGDPSAPSARGQVAGQAGFASKTLGSTFNDICVSVRVNPSDLDGNLVSVLRLRTAANGPVIRAYTTAAGALKLRSDVSAAQTSSTGTLAMNAWNRVELCGTVSPGAWSLYLNGAQIVNAWAANTGTTPVGMVQIGDAGAGTWTMNLDDVVVDQAPG